MKQIRGVECKGIVKQIRAAKSVKMSFLVALFLFAVSVCLVVGVSKQEVNASTTIYLGEGDNETSHTTGYSVLRGEYVTMTFDTGIYKNVCECMWYKDGYRIDNLIYEYTINENKLIIDSAKTSDSGTYYVKVLDNNGNYLSSEKVKLKVSETTFSADFSIVNRNSSYWINEGCYVEIIPRGGSGEYEVKIELCDVATGKIENTYFTYGYEHNIFSECLISQTEGWKNIKVTITDTFGGIVSITEEILFTEPVRVELLANGKNKELHIKERYCVDIAANITGGLGKYTATVIYNGTNGFSGSYEYDFSDDFSIPFNVPGTYTVYMQVKDANRKYAYSQNITIYVHEFDVWITNKDSIPKTIAVGDTIEIQYRIDCDYGSGTYINRMSYANAAIVEEDRILHEVVGVVRWTAKMEVDGYVSFTMKDASTNFYEYDYLHITVWKDGIYQEDDGNWYYYTEGNLNSAFTGMAQKGNEIWYIKNGVFVNTYTGMYVYNGKWIYVKNGKYDATYTGMARNTAGVWYMKNGNLDRTYTGMYLHNGKWIYVNNGKYDTSYTGMAKNSYGVWYMKNGVLDRTYTGMYLYNGKWIYVKDGKYDTSYTGMAKNSAGVWYMKNGVLDRTYTGMYIYDGSWIYVNKGKFDTSYTGMEKNSYGTWYMQKGKLDRTFSGKVVINGKTYTVKNGKLV